MMMMMMIIIIIIIIIIICGLVQVLFLRFVVDFYLFNSHFPLTFLDLGLFSGAYLYNLLFLWYPVTENNFI